MTDFKKLQAEWYLKLEDAGFVDIELKGNRLRDIDPRTKRRAEADREERESYTSAASEFLHIYQFRDELDRAIWEMHADGVSLRKIAKKLEIKKCKVEWVLFRLRSEANAIGFVTLFGKPRGRKN